MKFPFSWTASQTSSGAAGKTERGMDNEYAWTELKKLLGSEGCCTADRIAKDLESTQLR